MTETNILKIQKNKSLIFFFKILQPIFNYVAHTCTYNIKCFKSYSIYNFLFVCECKNHLFRQLKK